MYEVKVKRCEDSSKFREAAIRFEKHGYYTSAPPGTTAYMQYWDEELKRSIHGYTTSNGDNISGYFYFYLNYTRIIKTTEEIVGNKNIVKRVESFPRFYDYDRAYFDAIEETENEGKHLVVIKKRGAGYEQPYSEVVLTPSGEATMGSLKKGDWVMNPAGYSVEIDDIVEQGVQDVYEVELQDGRRVKCGQNHLWSVFDRRNKLRVLSTEELMKFKLKQGNIGKECYGYHLPSINEVEFGKRELTINPYVLGVLLGDGDLNGTQVKFSSNDSEIVNELVKLLPGYTIKKENGTPFKYGILSNISGINLLNRALKELDLKTTCYHKFIPNDYKYSSIEDRYELVCGLLDTDGSITAKGSIRFSSTSERLVDDLAYVLRSLGIRCRKSDIQKHKNPIKFPNGDKIDTKPFWVLVITTSKPIFKLSRKLNKIKKEGSYTRDRVAIKSIRKLDYKENQRCIVVANENNLYLTRDFIPTHNSYKGSSMLCRNFYCIPKSKSYAIASEMEFLTKDGLLTKAWEMMSFIDINTAWGKKRQKKDTIMHKRASFIIDNDTYGIKSEVGWGSEIMGVSLKNDPQKARGKRGKLILWEEAGKFPKLKEAWQIARPSVEDNNIAFGLMIAYGCVCEGTELISSNGKFIKVESLKKDDGVIGYNTYSSEQQVIQDFREPYETDCYKLITTSGKQLECSYDHPIVYSHRTLSKRVPGKRKENLHMKSWKWKEAKDFVVGDQMGVIEEVPFFGDKEMWNPRVIGWLIGDGSYGFDKTPVLSNCEPEINKYVEDNFNSIIEKSYVTKTGKSYRETRIRDITKPLRNLGIYGQTKDKKRLPDLIFECKKEDVCELLGGLFDTDGYISKPKNKTIHRIILSSAYKELLDQVSNLLLKLGIHGKIRFIKPRLENRKDVNGHYKLEISDVKSLIAFTENIKLLPKEKSDRLNFYKESLKLKSSELSKYIHGIRFERVVSVEHIGKRKVYNITASNTHTYIANGFITHNTGGTEDADYEGLKDLFYEPMAYNALPICNTWDDGTYDKACGFFVPQYYNMEGKDREGLVEKGRRFMDDNGNSDVVFARKYSIVHRDIIIEHSSDKTSIDRYIAERPFTPMEATLQIHGNIFPKKDLIRHLAEIRNSSKLRDFKQVGDLYFDSSGKVKWEIGTQYKDLIKYRLSAHDDPSGAIVIWEHPCDDPPYGLYIIGCLLPGEKVLTNEGLLNVEDINYTNRLVDKDGDLVNIKALLRYDKENEDIYTLKMSNSYRTTTFTKEHPIYVSDHSLNKQNLIKEDLFKFDFKKVSEVKVGDWIKYPNTYLDDSGWKEECDNYTFRENYWWFTGLWLGDGWCSKNRIYVCFDKTNTTQIERLRRFIKTYYEKDITTRERNGSIECSFSCDRLIKDLNKFGRYASGKIIPEHIKYEEDEIKKNLLLGFLDSDGCVYKDKRGYISLEYIGINLKLLEDFQDIAFSLGLVGNLSKLRDEGEYNIEGRVGKQQKAYHLRFGHTDSIKFAKMCKFDERSKLIKIDKDNIKQVRRRPKSGCFLSEDNKYIYFQIKDITKGSYTGVVYNFETETHSFCTHHIATHNCDPYDHDQSTTGSLGSAIVYKRFQNFESYYDLPVAEYTGRPETADVFYEKVRLLAIYYRAKILYENEKKGLFDYFSRKNSEYLLADQPDIIRDIVKDSRVSRAKGIHMTKSIKDWGEGAIKDWLIEEYQPGVKNLTKIFSEPLLEELIAYRADGNFDRVMAFMMIMIFIKELHHVNVKIKKEFTKRSLFKDGLFKDDDFKII